MFGGGPVWPCFGRERGQNEPLRGIHNFLHRLVFNLQTFQATKPLEGVFQCGTGKDRCHIL